MIEPFSNDFTRSLAEKCVFQLNLLVESFDIADNQIMKLSKVFIFNIYFEHFHQSSAQNGSLFEKIHIYYENFEQLNAVLRAYSKSHADYLNAHKFLFEFEMEYMKKFNMNAFQVSLGHSNQVTIEKKSNNLMKNQNIAKLSPSDSLILKNLKNLNDQVMSLDCLFDMLDFYQWKYDKTCWKTLNKLLLRSNKMQLFSYLM